MRKQRMNIFSRFILGFLFLALPLAAQSREKKDPIEQGLRDAFSAYQKEDLDTVAA
jgi:hypothetical protein